MIIVSACVLVVVLVVFVFDLSRSTGLPGVNFAEWSTAMLAATVLLIALSPQPKQPMKTAIRIICAVFAGWWGYTKAHYLFGVYSPLADRTTVRLACNDCPPDLYSMRETAPWSYIAVICGFLVCFTATYLIAGYLLKKQLDRF